MAKKGDQTYFPLIVKPGIKRDGTVIEGAFYTDAQHTRFQRGLPRKMGGYRSITEIASFPVRGVFVYSQDGINRVYLGSPSALEYSDLSDAGIGGGVGDRTPTGFSASDNNLWQFDSLFDGGGNAIALFAHAAPNLLQIDSSVANPIYFGIATDTALLTDSTAIPVSGGVCCSPPYAFGYGSDGFIEWCVPNTPNDWINLGSGNARIARQKIVKGIAARTGSGPGAVFWSLDAVINATFVGGAPIFNFATVSGQSSILSSSSVIEYDTVYYWVGIDRFLFYNGVVRETQNNMSINWFFDNLNWQYRNKVWATKVPRWGEIWWFFPYGNSTECNAAVIYNIRENTWYDTRMDRIGGYFSQVFRYPVFSANEQSNIPVRRLNGTPFSSAGGIAANAFDNNPATACTQTSPNGYISYDYGFGVTKRISNISITSQTTQTYDLLVETTQDGINWDIIADIAPASYLAGVEMPLVVNVTHVARAYRVRETGGATLNIQELYFMENGAVVYQHEFGVDKILGSQVMAIDAFFETCNISYMYEGPTQSGWSGIEGNIYLDRFVPDFIQSGTMNFIVKGKHYPNSSLSLNKIYPFNQNTQKIDVKEQRNIMFLRIESNTQGGDFQMGTPALKLHIGDGKP